MEGWREGGCVSERGREWWVGEREGGREGRVRERGREGEI